MKKDNVVKTVAFILSVTLIFCLIGCDTGTSSPTLANSGGGGPTGTVNPSGSDSGSDGLTDTPPSIISKPKDEGTGSTTGHLVNDPGGDEPGDGDTGNNSGGPNGDILNGKWVVDYIDVKPTWEITNGNWVYSLRGEYDSKGTYTADTERITITMTHLYGSSNSSLVEDFADEGITLSAGWYTKDQLVTLASGDSYLIDKLDHSFSSSSGMDYYLYNNKLILGSLKTLTKTSGSSGSLPGTWTLDDPPAPFTELTMEFMNGNVITSNEKGLYQQGTYTTSNGGLITTWTHYYGGNDYVIQAFSSLGDHFYPQWYSEQDIHDLASSLGYYIAFLEQYFDSSTLGYAINGNELILAMQLYTKQL